MDKTDSTKNRPVSPKLRNDRNIDKVLDPKLGYSLEEYIRVCEQSTVPSVIYNIDDNRLVSANNLMKGKFGVTSESIFDYPLYELGKKLQIRGTISKHNFQENMIKAIKGVKQEFREIFTNLNGEIFLAKITMEKIIVLDSNYIFIALEDISDLDINSALSQLADPERIFMSNAVEGIMIIDPTFPNSPDHVKHLNTRMADILGYQLEEIKSFPLMEPPLSPLIQPNGKPSLEFFAIQLTEALNDEEPTFGWQHLHKLGHKVYVEIRLRKFVYNGIPFVRASYIDITEKRNREAKKTTELFESERRYEFLLKYAPEAILLYDVPSQSMSELDEKNKVTYINENFAKMLKYTEKELEDKILYAPPYSPEIQPNGKNSKDWVIELNKRVFDGDSPVYEWLHYDSNGDEVYCEIRLLLLPFQGKTVVRGTVVNITDKKQKEKELQQLQKELNHSMKMEAIGRLAGGITHNFNNIISTIVVYTDYLISNTHNRTDIEILKEIQKAADSATSLSRQLLDFSRKREVETKRLDINSIINSSKSIIRHSIPKSIEIEYDLAVNLFEIQIDPFEFEQVLMNMIINARDAIESKKSTGKIVISTNYMDIRMMRGKFRLLQHDCDCSFVVLSIQDDGSGMDDTIQDKIFEPFFTTKGEEKGTGLGLSSVYSFMTNIRGHVDFETEINEGTIFNLYFQSVRDRTCNSEFHS